MPASTSPKPTPSRSTPVTAPPSFVPECPPLMPGQSVQQYTQGLAALRAELGADTTMKAHLASKIYECLWWLNCYDEAKKAQVLERMKVILGLSSMFDHGGRLSSRLIAMDWGDERLLAKIAAEGHTPDSLYALAVATSKDKLLVLEQLSAIRTKSLQQLQSTYEAYIKRPVLLEILRLERDKLARSLTAIDVTAATIPTA